MVADASHLPARHESAFSIRSADRGSRATASSTSSASTDFDPASSSRSRAITGVRGAATVRLDATILRYSDKPTLVLSPSGKDVYVAFNGGTRSYVASSHDGGATWQAPVKATSEHLWYYSYGGTAAPTVPFGLRLTARAGRDETGDGHVELVTSGDGGATWRTIPFAVRVTKARRAVATIATRLLYRARRVAVDGKGAYVFIFAKNATKQGPNALYESRSRDGMHWGVPSAINTLGNNTSPAILPGITPGDFRLVWQDNRNGPHAWNTWYAQSTDAGATWNTPVRLSDRGSGEPYKRKSGLQLSVRRLPRTLR